MRKERKPLIDEYIAARKSLDDKYYNDCNKLFEKYRDLFAVPENRAKAQKKEN